MISRVSKSFSEESNLVSAEVLIKYSNNSNFSLGLGCTFWCSSLDKSDKEVENFGIMKDFCRLSADITQHEVSLLVLEWVVKTILGYGLKTLDEWLDFLELSVGELDHIFTSHGVDKSSILGGFVPLSLDKVHTFVFGRKTLRINSGKCLKVL